MIVVAAFLALTLAGPQLIRVHDWNVVPSWFGPSFHPALQPTAFSAETEESWTLRYPDERSERVERGRIFLASDGRVRKDDGPRGDFGVAVDPVTRRTVLFNPRKNKPYESAGDADDTADRWGEPGLVPVPPADAPERKRKLLSPTDVDLGTRVIEGFLCEGVRRTIPPDKAEGVRRTIPPRKAQEGMPRQIAETIEVETWASRELGQVLLETRRSEHETSTLRLKNIRVGEPDESVFAILKQISRRTRSSDRSR
jgi:hypothetical protein